MSKRRTPLVVFLSTGILASILAGALMMHVALFNGRTSRLNAFDASPGRELIIRDFFWEYYTMGVLSIAAGILFLFLLVSHPNSAPMPKARMLSWSVGIVLIILSALLAVTFPVPPFDWFIFLAGLGCLVPVLWPLAAGRIGPYPYA